MWEMLNEAGGILKDQIRLRRKFSRRRYSMKRLRKIIIFSMLVNRCNKIDNRSGVRPLNSGENAKERKCNCNSRKFYFTQQQPLHCRALRLQVYLYVNERFYIFTYVRMYV